MIKAFQQFFKMIFTLFEAGERGANIVNELAKVGEEGTKGYCDELRVEREARMQRLKDQLQLPNNNEATQ